MALTLISSTTVAGSSTSLISFSSIPQTFNFLYIVGAVRTNRSGNIQDTVLIKPNGQTGNMFYSGGFNNASTTITWQNLNSTWQMPVLATTNLTSTYNAFTMWISAYSISNRAKMMLINAQAVDNLTTGSTMLHAGGRWDVTNAALTSLEFVSATSSTFTAGTRIDLYGAK